MPIDFHLPVVDISLNPIQEKKNKTGKQSRREEFWIVLDNKRRPERSAGAAVRQFRISNLKSTSSQSGDSGEEVGVGLGLHCVGGFKIAAGGQKKKRYGLPPFA